MLNRMLALAPGELCATGNLTDCTVTYDSDTCPGGIDITIKWDGSVCDDCHHIEIWRKIQTGSCSGGTYTYQSGLTCECLNDPAGCDPGGTDIGCQVDGDVEYEYNAGGTTTYFCYNVRVCEDGHTPEVRGMTKCSVRCRAWLTVVLGHNLWRTTGGAT